MKIFITVLITLIMAQLAYPDSKTYAQDDDIMKLNREGKEFWITFIQNRKPPKEFNKDWLKLQLVIIGANDSKVVVENKSVGFRREVFVKPDSISVVDIPLEFQLNTTELLQDLALRVVSDKPVVVYGVSRNRSSTDTFSAIPSSSLGKNYLIASQENYQYFFLSEYAVIATEDDTEISIFYRYSPDMPAPPDEGAIKKTMNKGEIYTYMHKPEFKSPAMMQFHFDLTGTKIISNKNVAVFSGHQCANVPVDVSSCNHLVEQTPPLESCGRDFIVTPLAMRSQSTYRIVASEDKCDLEIDSVWVDELAEGAFYDVPDLAGTAVIKTSCLAVAAQYSQGYMNGDSIGDPMMLLIRPIDQFQKKFLVATPISGSWNHYINITAHKDAVKSVKINGKTVDEDKFEDIQSSEYMYARIKIVYGVYKVECDMPINVVSYGFGFGKDEFDAYGNM